MNDEATFNEIGTDQAPKNFGVPLQETGQAKDINERLKSIVSSSDVVLFMKGTPDSPQCGFSANTVAILNSLRVPFKTFDVFSDENVRQGIKAYSDWPTFPQLYYKGQLVGGNDIITDMYKDGSLRALVQKS